MTALDNGAAVRRRERRLLCGLRHEQINVAMNLAAHVARRSAEPEDRHQRSTPFCQADHGAQCVSQRLVGQFIDVLPLKSVIALSLEQTTDVPIVEKDLLVDEPEDAVDVVEDVVDTPGPTAKLTFDVFVSQFQKEFGRTGSMCCGRHGGDNSARFSSRSMEECRTHGQYHCACHMQRSTNQWLHQILSVCASCAKLQLAGWLGVWSRCW